MSVSFEPIAPDPDWIIGKHALLNVIGRVQDGRTVLEPRSWRIPFQWQGYHYQDHDDEAFLLLLNSGGGFVEGDVSQFHADLGPETRTLITTTAASKFYKSIEGLQSREIVDIRLGPGALLEYCPDEAIPYERSRAYRLSRIAMTESSRLFATDMISAGRVHYGSGETFKFDSLISEFNITIDDRPLALDRLVATTPAAIDAMPRLWRGAAHLATAFAYAPDLPARAADALEALGAASKEIEMGFSRIGNLIAVRLLCHETWRAHEMLFDVWSLLRPMIAGKPARPIRKC